MKSSTRNAAKTNRDISYYRQRYKNRVFSKIVSFVAEQAQREQMTKKDIAEKLNKDPALISRWLSQPSNLTLDTISDLLLALDAEAEPPEIMLFKDKPAPNYMNPLMARVLNVQTGILSAAPTSREKTVSPTPTEQTVDFGRGATAA